MPLRARALASRASGPGGEVTRAQRRGKPRLPVQVAPEILDGGEPGRDIIVLIVVGACLSPEVRDGDLVFVDKRYVWPVHGCLMAFGIPAGLDEFVALPDLPRYVMLKEYVKRDGRAYWSSNEGEFPVGGPDVEAPHFLIGSIVALQRDGETIVLDRPRGIRWAS